MAKTIVATTKAPGAIGPYSQGVKANGFVFASGQLGLVPETGEFAAGGVSGQTRQSLTNVQHVLEAAGSGLEKVVKVTVFFKRHEGFCGCERSVFRIFQRGLPGPFRRPGSGSSQRRAGGD